MEIRQPRPQLAHNWRQNIVVQVAMALVLMLGLALKMLYCSKPPREVYIE